MNDLVRLTALVSGTVQGVGYRRFVQRQCEILHLAGYAENLADNRVEVVAEGAKSELEHLLHWLQKGSTHAVVESVEVTWGAATGLKDFFVF
ncbi:MAG: acylphosphatase [Deinococcales bacterium]